MIEKNRRVDLSTQFPYHRLDGLMQYPLVATELKDTWFKARLFRDPKKRKKILENPPRFRFVLEFHRLIYDRAKKKIIEGAWNDLHEDLAKEQGLVRDQRGDPSFFSGDSFALRGLPQIKVVMINTLYGFDVDTLKELQGGGNVVMDPLFNWLIQDPTNLGGYLEIPSSMSMNRRE